MFDGQLKSSEFLLDQAEHFRSAMPSNRRISMIVQYTLKADQSDSGEKSAEPKPTSETRHK
jgi:hypothetical protein